MTGPRVLVPLAAFALGTLALVFSAQAAEEPWTDQLRQGQGAGRQDAREPAAEGTKEQEEEVKIEDNSFLIEEAVNQEQGVVQHIFNWVPSWKERLGRRRTFDFVFTQEWPVYSQQHQFSYTIPMQYTYDRPDGQPAATGQGFGDMLLNYRYQLVADKDRGFFCAPRFSVILPTGDLQAGLGNGQVGYQAALPLSEYLDRWAFHFNAGMTVTPNVSAGVDPALAFAGQTLCGNYLGGSAIYYLRPNFHLMLETLATWDQSLTFEGRRDRTFQYLLSPGFRWAPFTEGDTQWVVGMGVPVGLTEDSPDVSLFLYMSFEHRVRKQRDED